MREKHRRSLSASGRFAGTALPLWFGWLAASTALALGARAEIRIFELDPASSVLQLEGTFKGIPLEAQGTDGLRANYEGRLVCDLGDGTVRLVAGSVIRAQSPRVWEPGTATTPGPAPASYGAKGSKGSGFDLAFTTLALRRIGFQLSSEELTLGADPATGAVYLTVDGAPHPTVDYVWHQLVSRAGSLPLSGVATNASAAGPTLRAMFEVQQLSLPVEVVLPADLGSPGDGLFRLTGTLVGRHSLNLLDPELIWIPGDVDGPVFTLIWNAGGTLQQARQLGPPDWADVSASAPYPVPATADSGFFRVVFR